MKWLLVAAFLASAGLYAGTAEARVPVRIIASEERTEVTDVVKKIREDDEGIVVLFTKHQGSYYLRRTTEEFDAYRKKLDDSLKSKKPVSVTADQELNIVEVK